MMWGMTNNTNTNTELFDLELFALDEHGDPSESLGRIVETTGTDDYWTVAESRFVNPVRAALDCFDQPWHEQIKKVAPHGWTACWVPA